MILKPVYADGNTAYVNFVLQFVLFFYTINCENLLLSHILTISFILHILTTLPYNNGSLLCSSLQLPICYLTLYTHTVDGMTMVMNETECVYSNIE